MHTIILEHEMDEVKKDTTRLTVVIPCEMHKRLKRVALERDTTIRLLLSEWINGKLDECKELA